MKNNLNTQNNISMKSILMLTAIFSLSAFTSSSLANNNSCPPNCYGGVGGSCGSKKCVTVSTLGSGSGRGIRYEDDGTCGVEGWLADPCGKGLKVGCAAAKK